MFFGNSVIDFSCAALNVGPARRWREFRAHGEPTAPKDHRRGPLSGVT
jgi:hypothetical protein